MPRRKDDIFADDTIDRFKEDFYNINKKGKYTYKSYISPFD